MNHDETSSLPRRQQITLFVIALGLIGLPWLTGLGGDSWVRILDVALLYVMLALGLNIVVGFAGLLDLGYIAFYAVGAYLYALLASPHLVENFPWIAALFPDGLHASIWLILPLGALVAALFGVLLGAPTLKLRGDYLAIVTLGFGEIVRIFLINLNAPVNVTNGPQGINMIEPVQIAGVSFSQGVNWAGFEVPALHLYYYLFLALVVLMIFVCMRLQNSRLGR
ncbi:MAG: ABC transporter ATP-binding protein, partial [Limnobacter sp.]|nr:ABC transporter ATP-binding protein [Limnobacter sp.]